LHIGLLHALPSDARLTHRVSWTVVTDPSFKMAAAQLKAWRNKGLLPAQENGFSFAPDATNYCAWFCADEKGLPLEKGFFDYRLELFSDSVISDYEEPRRALRDGPTQATSDLGASTKLDNWQRLFREQKINHVLTREPREPGYRLMRDWPQWRMVYLDG